ncbi:MAG: tetratricopeptide repeat protein, partial [Magnetovibrio sp.]|nr:tetratricopeptide repeat protein [Magnetovibrio sp.]
MTSIVSTDHLEHLQDAIKALIANDPNQALEVIQGILKKDPEIPEALHLLGLCSLILGDSGRAMEMFNSAHQIDPECRDYVDALASLKAQAGDINSSLYFAKLATTLEPHPEL